MRTTLTTPVVVQTDGEDRKRPWKIFSGQNNPAHDEKSLCSQKLIQINYARFYIIIEAYMEGGSLY